MSTRNQTKQKLERKAARHARVRATVLGTAAKPRLCVSRSNQHIQAQIIDDQKGVTLAVCRDTKAAKTAKPAEGGLRGKSGVAYEVGMQIAKIAQEKKIKEVVFDRGGNRYHGRVKSLAEGARKGGLEF